jgi:hypothetical protein
VSALPACVHENFAMKMLFLVRDYYTCTVMCDCEFKMDKFNEFFKMVSKSKNSMVWHTIINKQD